MQDDKIKLNLGCGAVRPKSWINTDSSLNANLQRIPLIGNIIQSAMNTRKYDDSNVIYMNLNKKWNFKDKSVDIVYASHLFEHLSLKTADLFLKESKRCLKDGGIIRIVVPDLYKICKAYINEYESNLDSDPTKFIMWAINMNREGQYGSNISLFKKIIYEIQGYPHQHKFMYDEKSLTIKLRTYGFNNIISQEYGISKFIPEIKDVEGSNEAYLSVYIEAKN